MKKLQSFRQVVKNLFSQAKVLGISFFKPSKNWVMLGIVLWAGWLLALLLLAASFPYALEESDEASFVLASANPWASPGWGILFGFGLYPLWELGGGSVEGFRWAGVIVLISVTGLLVDTLRRCAVSLNCSLLGRIPLLVMPSLALAALSTYTRGMRAPGYDWLLVVAGILFAAGWIQDEAGIGWETKRRGAFLVAMGMFLVLVAKWTAIPGYLALWAFLYFFRWKKDRLSQRSLRSSMWWLVVLMIGLLIYATPSGIYQVIQAGCSQTMTGSHDGLVFKYLNWIFQFGWVVLRAWLWVVIIFLLIWLFSYFIRMRNPDFKKVVGFVFLAFLPVAFLQGHWRGGEEAFTKGKMIIAIWLMGVYVLTWRARHSKDSSLSSPSNSASCRIICMLCSLPFLNGLGTATGFANYINHGAVFFVAAGWIWLAQAFQNGMNHRFVTIPIAVLAIIQSCRTVSTPWHTYRVGSVWGQKTPVSAGPENGRLRLSPMAVGQLENIYRAMRQVGYCEGDPVVGLTSLCNLVYLLGGTSPGVCWYMDNPTPNSGSVNNLKNIPAKVLSNAWLIILDDDSPLSSVQKFWPSGKAPSPTKIQGEFFWPMGDGDGVLRSISLYRPSLP